MDALVLLNLVEHSFCDEVGQVLGLVPGAGRAEGVHEVLLDATHEGVVLRTGRKAGE